ncbi:T9SS type A sorting domain-containing protein [bacterium]|nr:T9SS type A sorting domain-containing protein [bacterium]
MKGFPILLLMSLLWGLAPIFAQVDMKFAKGRTFDQERVMAFEMDSAGNKYMLNVDESTVTHYSDTADVILKKLDASDSVMWEARISSIIYSTWFTGSPALPKVMFGLASVDSSVFVSFTIFRTLFVNTTKDTKKIYHTTNDTAGILIKFSADGRLLTSKTHDIISINNLPCKNLKKVNDSILCLSYFYRRKKMFLDFIDPRDLSLIKRVNVPMMSHKTGSFGSTNEIHVTETGNIYLELLEAVKTPITSYVHLFKLSFSGKILWHGIMGADFRYTRFTVDKKTDKFYIYTTYPNNFYDRRINIKSCHLDLFDSTKGIINIDSVKGYNHHVVAKYDSSGRFEKSFHFFSDADIGKMSTLRFGKVLNDTMLVFFGAYITEVKFGNTKSSVSYKTNEDTLQQDAYMFVLDTGLNMQYSQHIEIFKNSKYYPVLDIRDNVTDAFVHDKKLIMAGDVMSLDFFDDRFKGKPVGTKKAASAAFLLNYDFTRLGKPVSLIGPSQVCFGDSIYTFRVPAVEHAESYAWQLPKGAQAIGDSTKNSIKVKFHHYFTHDTLHAFSLRTGQRRKSPPFLVQMATDTAVFLRGSWRHCLGDTISITSAKNFSELQVYYNGGQVYKGAAKSYNTHSLFTGATLAYKVKEKHSACYFHSNELVFTVDTPEQANMTLDVKDHAICDREKLIIEVKGSDSLWIYRDKNLISAGTTRKQRIYKYYDKAVFRLVAKDSNGCLSFAYDTLTVFPLPPINAGADQSVCAGDTVVLNGSGGKKLTWRGTVQNGVPFVPAGSAAYILTGKSTDGCYNSDTTTVTVHQLPDVKANSDTSICKNERIKLEASGALYYNWNGGHYQNEQLKADSSQSFHVKGIDSFGCVNYDSFNLNVWPLPQLVLSKANAVCTGDSARLFAGSTDSVFWEKTIPNGSKVPIEKSAFWHVQATTIHGCILTDSLLVPALPLPDIVAMADTSLCANDSLKLIAAGGKNYIWSSGETNGDYHKVQGNENLVVKGFDDHGCQAIDSLHLTAIPLPTVFAGADTSLCMGESLELQAHGNAVDYTWDGNLKNHSFYNVAQTTSLKVWGSDSNGCVATDSLHITAWQLPKPQLGANQTLQRDDSLWLNPGHFSSYLWNEQSTDSQYLMSYYVQGEGVFTTRVKVADANGCHASDSVLITILPNGMAHETGKLSVNIYPNPFATQLHIAGIKGKYTYKLYNVQSQLLLIGTAKNVGTLTLPQLPAGSYYLQIRTANGMVSKVLLKE